MRELKFRAWDKLYDRMEDFKSEDKAILYGAYSGFQVSSGYDSYDRPTFEDDTANRYEIMQYTGLKDRDGVEIYEGDVIEWASTYGGAVKEKHIDVMEWDGTACFMLKPFCHEPHAADMKVIGNIYRNPDLIKQA